MSRIRAATPCTGPRIVSRVMTVELLCRRRVPEAARLEGKDQRTQRNLNEVRS